MSTISPTCLNRRPGGSNTGNRANPGPITKTAFFAASTLTSAKSPQQCCFQYHSQAKDDTTQHTPQRSSQYYVHRKHFQHPELSTTAALPAITGAEPLQLLH
ncbi:uncharacterized protein TrAtP1_005687 [Trichoderma atroviride]|uniref:uncharacterized protein n=1 Tax=Hypocrea atroviridis TaxID=63577 RepID=UPI003319C228|nr:hypothetical protein TrAtP1_005687 [Trichoderma atroviride]